MRTSSALITRPVEGQYQYALSSVCSEGIIIDNSKVNKALLNSLLFPTLPCRYTHLKLAQAEASPSSSGPEGQQLQPLLPQQSSIGTSTSRFDPHIMGKSVYTLSSRHAGGGGGGGGGGVGPALAVVRTSGSGNKAG